MSRSAINAGDVHYALGRMISPSVVLAKNAGRITMADTTDETTLATITVPANSMGVHGGVRVRVWFANNNTADDKIVAIKFGGVTVVTITVTTTTIGYLEATVFNRGSAAVQFTHGLSVLAAAIASQASADTHDTTADTDITITGDKETATDDLYIDAYLVEILP